MVIFLVLTGEANGPVHDVEQEVERGEKSDKKTDSAGNHLRSSFHYVFGLFEDKTFGLIKKDPQDETTQRQL